MSTVASLTYPRQALNVGLLLWLALIFSACNPPKRNQDEPVAPNDSLEKIAPGHWFKLHEQKTTDAVTFKRQAHGGSAFDTKRNQIVLFGSDTHGQDWTNSPLVFDTQQLKWQRLYADDPPGTYTVTHEGIPVAGKSQNHPWAMHTFGAVEYDSGRDELIISSYPGHMVPGRFSDALVPIWHKVSRHPTWLLDMNARQWKSLSGKPVHFFPYTTAFDRHRGVVVGYKPDGVYELAGEPRRWTRVLSEGLLGYHNNAVYDDKNRKVIVMGSNNNSNDVVVYDPATRQQRMMPTPGTRPPKDQHIPMAFHSKLGKTVALIDNIPAGVKPSQRTKITTETWLYDFGEDRWERIETASLPFGCGMNYNLEYEPQRSILWLVTSEPDGATSVWVLRL